MEPIHPPADINLEEFGFLAIQISLFAADLGAQKDLSAHQIVSLIAQSLNQAIQTTGEMQGVNAPEYFQYWSRTMAIMAKAYQKMADAK